MLEWALEPDGRMFLGLVRVHKDGTRTAWHFKLEPDEVLALQKAGNAAFADLQKPSLRTLEFCRACGTHFDQGAGP